MKLLRTFTFALLLFALLITAAACMPDEPQALGEQDASQSRSVTVRFFSDGEILREQTIRAEETVTPPDLPEEKASLLLGWFAEGEDDPFDFTKPVGEQDLDLYARYDARTVKVSFLSRGERIRSEELPPYSVITPPDLPEDPICVFSGWFATGAKEAFDFSSPIGGEDVVFTAGWSPVEIRVTFLAKGVPVSRISADSDRQISPPDAPDDPALVFDGWYCEGDTEPFDFTKPVGKTDLTLTARYTAKQITVRYFSDGDEVAKVTQMSDEPLSPPALSEKLLYSLAGWASHGESVPMDLTAPAGKEDLSLSAIWQAVPVKVAFFSDEEKIAEVTVLSDQALTPPAPEKDGFHLAGWMRDGEIYDVTAPVGKSDFFLTAVWQEDIPPIVSVTVSFYSDGDLIRRESVNSDETVTPPQLPEKLLYVFGGWSLAGEIFDFSRPVGRSPLTLTAVWNTLSVSADFYADGAPVSQIRLRSDETITPPDAPEKDGYRFLGWQAEGAEDLYDFRSPIGKTDLVLHAVYEKIRVRLTYLSDGIAVAEQIVDYGEKAVAPELSKKHTEVLTGWYAAGASEPFDFSKPVGAEGLVLTAKWETVQVTLTFLSGDVLTQQTLSSDGYAAEPEHAERIAYRFDGWFAEEAEIPFDFSSPVGTENLTLTARYSEAFRYEEVDGGIILTEYLDDKTDVLLPHEMYGKTVLSFAAIFQNTQITSIDIAEGYTEVPDDAFSGCASLSAVILPSTLVRIGHRAFRGCSILRRITIPKSVIYIGSQTFKSCPKLIITALVSRQQNGWYPDWNPDNRQVNYTYNDENLLPIHYF